MYTGRMTRDNYVLGLAEARQGYALNRLLGSLTDPANRERFGADEAAYCDGYGLPPAATRAVLERDYTALLERGASVFCAFKLTMVDRATMQHLSAGFTGMSPEEFDAMMRAGGRQPASQPGNGGLSNSELSGGRRRG
jgi:protocatechuate 4,5-dioxygenase alpha subunit